MDYETLSELVDREIVPALDGVHETFDLDGFVGGIDQIGLIVRHQPDPRRNVRYSMASDREDDFWRVVESFDRAACRREGGGDHE